MPEPYINIHTHRKARSDNEFALRNAFHLNSKADYPVSCGLHPWHIAKHYNQNNMDTIESNLSKSNVYAIGECGLDKAIETDMDLQKKILLQHIHWAEQYNKPLIIHCVKAYNELMPFIKNSKAIFILHGYKGSEEQSKQLLQYNNVYFSFGKKLFMPDEKYVVSIKQIPLERTLLETDNSNFNIESIYQKYAEQKGMELDVIKKQLYSTFAQIFNR